MSLVRARIGSIKSQTARLYRMSSTLGTEAKAKHEWIVILPDHDGALETRMKVRQWVLHFSVLPTQYLGNIEITSIT